MTKTGAGLCESELLLEDRHRQQNGFAHAGVVATMADHTAGAAAVTELPSGIGVLTVEFKVNLLRPGGGNRLRCVSKALKVGKTLAVCESEVFARDGEVEKLIAKAMVTLAVVPDPA